MLPVYQPLRALSRKHGRAGPRPDPKAQAAFRAYVQQQWDELMPYQDVYYGFEVDPRVPLADLARYCADRRADPTYRAQIASYLAYLATTAPVLAERHDAAIRALFTAHRPRLRRAVRRLVDEGVKQGQKLSPDERQAASRAALDDLGMRFADAVAEFDVLWLEPAPLFPLGTLSMAWEPLAGRPTSHTSWYPERHLSFANRIEGLVR